MASKVKEIVTNRNPEDPMFLYLAFPTPHAPLLVPKKYSDIYSDIPNETKRIYYGE